MLYQEAIKGKDKLFIIDITINLLSLGKPQKKRSFLSGPATTAPPHIIFLRLPLGTILPLDFFIFHFYHDAKFIICSIFAISDGSQIVDFVKI